ncbi:MAG: DUF5661 family protein [Candidatus Diapherotrites archaeon]
MTSKKHFSSKKAKETSKKLKINWSKAKYNLEQFRHGMDIELEHGKVDKNTNVTNNNPLITGKIALAHLNEFPDYYKRLDKLETSAEKFWKNKNKLKR